MSSPTADIGQGTTLTIGSFACKILSLTPPSQTREVATYAGLDDTYESKILGRLVKTGELKLKVCFKADYVPVVTDAATDCLIKFRDNVWWHFVGNMTEYTPGDVGPDGLMEADITVASTTRIFIHGNSASYSTSNSSSTSNSNSLSVSNSNSTSTSASAAAA